MYHHRAREEEEYISPSSSTTPDSDEQEEDDDDDDDDDGNRERRIVHYTSSQRILLVGEGDFSFSLSLAKAFSSARNMVSTSIDTQQDLFKKYSNGVGNVRDLEVMGCVVLYGVDATKMSQHYFLTTQRFDRIVYNFPHVGFLFPEANGCQIKLNKQLIKGFLRNAKALLKEGGEIHVSHKNGEPYDKWDLVKKAKKIGLALHESVPFCKAKYPGYGNKRAHEQDFKSLTKAKYKRGCVACGNAVWRPSELIFPFNYQLSCHTGNVSLTKRGVKCRVQILPLQSSTSCPGHISLPTILWI